VVRADRPASMSSAFEAPLTGEGGYVAGSVARLADHAASIAKLRGTDNILWSGFAADDLAIKTVDDAAAAFGTRHEAFASLVSAAVAATYGELS